MRAICQDVSINGISVYCGGSEFAYVCLYDIGNNNKCGRADGKWVFVGY